MTAYDMVVLAVMGYSLIRGAFRGLIKEVSSIIGVLGGFYAAYTYYPLLSAILAKWFTKTDYLNVTSFLLIFCAVFLAISFFGVVIKYILNVAFLGWVDRIFGAAFGICKGLLVASVLLVALTAFLPSGAPIIKDSILAPHVMQISERMASVVGKDLRRQFENKLQILKKDWGLG